MNFNSSPYEKQIYFEKILTSKGKNKVHLVNFIPYKNKKLSGKKFTSFRKKVHFLQKKSSFHSEKSFGKKFRKNVQFAEKKSSLCWEKKVSGKSSLCSEKKFTSYRKEVHVQFRKKVHLVQKKGSRKNSLDEKCSVHVSSEGSHDMREKVHLVQKKSSCAIYNFVGSVRRFTWCSVKVHLAYPRRFRKFLFSLNRNRFLFSWVIFQLFCTPLQNKYSAQLSELPKQ